MNGRGWRRGLGEAGEEEHERNAAAHDAKDREPDDRSPIQAPDPEACIGHERDGNRHQQHRGDPVLERGEQHRITDRTHGGCVEEDGEAADQRREGGEAEADGGSVLRSLPCAKPGDHGLSPVAVLRAAASSSA